MNEKKNTISLILSIIAIVLAIGIILQWIVNASHLAVVSLDKEIFAELEEDHKVITNAPSFNCISVKFKQIHNMFLSKVTSTE